MKSADIREKFLRFFENHHHQRVPSSSLIPAADPTLLFTAAGMVQFKDCFLGTHDPGYRRATTAQKCVRAGGKHNDLENVGFTPRHHTFFEMLGNFSFGDYFKKEAIAYAWELLTRHYGIPQERLRITIFETDDEAFEIWKAQGIRPDWITRLGEKDNFWAAGDTGPCGPCTEIHFDWGEKYGPDDLRVDSGRFLEIWNLVFMQFNRDTTGKLTPLPKPSVDTGSGLERVAAVLQGKYSNYDTDVFQPIIADISKRVGREYGVREDDSISMRVIADHLRSGTFLLADGVTPSNEGRGYVLRRILRRAIRHGKKLGQDKPFMHELVSSVVASLGAIYPELLKNQKILEVMMREEEERFHETLHRGMGLLEESIAKTKKSGGKVIPGEVAFKLYDTFGFPYDLIEVIGREQGLSVDDKMFGELMEKQRSQSVFHKGPATSWAEAAAKAIESGRLAPAFRGYEVTQLPAKLELLLAADGTEVTELAAGAEGFAVFEATPFYAESGGQVGDRGTVTGPGVLAKVHNTTKVAKAPLHWLKVESGKLARGASYQLTVDARARKLTAINHTATHMLHAALRRVLGERVKQAGSLVDSERLRFDFTWPKSLSTDEKQQIEKIISDEILLGRPVTVQEMGYDDALKSGALAFFDEKYGDRVRVVKVAGGDAPFSVELCGGTHLTNVGDIGVFRILSESSVASGVRRIEALTSRGALKHLDERIGALEKQLDGASAEKRALQKENERLQLAAAQAGGGKAGGGGGAALWDKKVQIKDWQIVRETLDAVNPKVLRSLVDQVRDKLKDKTLVCLGSQVEGKVFLCVGLTKDLAAKYDASKIIQPLAEELGGTGGGRADFAQAGGANPAGLAKAMEKLEAWVRENA